MCWNRNSTGSRTPSPQAGEAESLVWRFGTASCVGANCSTSVAMPFGETLTLATLRLELERRLGEWRSVLLGQMPRARNLLKPLIVGRLEMSPHKERYYSFRGTGTVLLLSQPLCHRAWSPDASQLERDRRLAPEDR